MRKALFIFIALLLAVSACTERRKETVCLLTQAEKWIYISPDTVCHLLEDLVEKDLQNKDDYYHYYLLCMEAGMKSRHRLYDTLIVGRMVRHYEKGKDLKMLARAYRLWGYAYELEQDKRCYSYFMKSIDYARQTGDKRLLADIYLYASAGIHFQTIADDGGSLMLKRADSLYKEAEKMAYEMEDTLFLLETWHHGSTERFYRREYKSAEQLMLKGFAMAETFGSKDYEAKFAMELSWLYGEDMLNDKEKSLYYIKRNLAAREGEVDEWLYHLTLSEAYRRIGQKDSADYYRREAERLKNPKHEWPDFKPVLLVWDDEVESVTFYYLLIGLILLGATTGFVFLRRRHLRTLSIMQRELDILSPHAPLVFDKIDRIVKDHLYKNRSELHMEEADWKQLQLETDKRWNHITLRLQKKYHLTNMEIRLFCLNLTEVPTMHMPYLFDRGRSTIYNKNRELLSKLKIERTSNTFKEDLKAFIEKEK